MDENEKENGSVDSEGLMGRWKAAARALKTQTYALALAYRDPRLPWHARLVAGLVVLYAFSPIDLVPDFIPVLGYLDDLIILPLGVALALRLIPAEIMQDCRARAAAEIERGGGISRAGAMLIVLTWLVLALLGFLLVRRILSVN